MEYLICNTEDNVIRFEIFTFLFTTGFKIAFYVIYFASATKKNIKCTIFSTIKKHDAYDTYFEASLQVLRNIFLFKI